MRIPAPKIEWPPEFATEGPDQDPTIMLSGHARIADVGFRIIALRMRKGFRSPDYREDVPDSAYQEVLERMVDDIEDLIDSLAPCLITIDNAEYLLWMVPDARE
jgi:pimeloyl-ACP methyl ester carboxylesterase